MARLFPLQLAGDSPTTWPDASNPRVPVVVKWFEGWAYRWSSSKERWPGHFAWIAVKSKSAPGSPATSEEKNAWETLAGYVHER